MPEHLRWDQWWTDAHARHAAEQGWGLFHHTGKNEVEIECFGEPEDWAEQFGFTPPALDGDDVAIDLVLHQAAQGDTTALLALWLEGRRANDSEIWVPPLLREPGHIQALNKSPGDYSLSETCDECGATIPVGAPSMTGDWHQPSCSLHPTSIKG